MFMLCFCKCHNKMFGMKAFETSYNNGRDWNVNSEQLTHRNHSEFFMVFYYEFQSIDFTGFFNALT